MKKLTLIIVITILLMGCADVSPEMLECAPDDPYGFLSGLWHGMTVPFSFFGRLFSDDIAIYAINNNGKWYDFGFWLGVGGLVSGIKKT